MTIKEISPKLHQFVNEVSLGYKGTIDLNLIREAADRLEELESKQENLIDYSADLNNRLDKAESYTEKLEKQLAENQPEPEPPKPKEPNICKYRKNLSLRKPTKQTEQSLFLPLREI